MKSLLAIMSVAFLLLWLDSATADVILIDSSDIHFPAEEFEC